MLEDLGYRFCLKKPEELALKIVQQEISRLTESSRRCYADELSGGRTCLKRYWLGAARPSGLLTLGYTAKRYYPETPRGEMAL